MDGKGPVTSNRRTNENEVDWGMREPRPGLRGFGKRHSAINADCLWFSFEFRMDYSSLRGEERLLQTRAEIEAGRKDTWPHSIVHVPSIEEDGVRAHDACRWQ